MNLLTSLFSTALDTLFPGRSHICFVIIHRISPWLFYLARINALRLLVAVKRFATFAYANAEVYVYTRFYVSYHTSRYQGIQSDPGFVNFLTDFGEHAHLFDRAILLVNDSIRIGVKTAFFDAIQEHLMKVCSGISCLITSVREWGKSPPMGSSVKSDDDI
jgi:hypothetical protein